MTRTPITTEQAVEAILDFYNTDALVLTTEGLKVFCEQHGHSLATMKNRIAEYKYARGKYSIRRQLENAYEAPAAQDLVPRQDDNYVPFGNFKDIKQIIKSGVFLPVFITGLSGNGKTYSVEQACAQLKRELVRVNITVETDQDDLIGGFRLVDGNTAWHDGPVIDAMRRGAVLLLDEVDLASHKIMALQSVLEGKGYYVKKTNEWVQPAPGFTVVATANTRGQGDDTGMFIGTNVLNEAFLERFAFTFQQDYPTPAVETKILTRIYSSLGVEIDESQIKHLVTWAEIIRKTYDDGGVDSVITTRRLVNVVKALAVWRDIHKAIDLTTARFDDDTRQVFVQLYSKVSGDVETVSDTHNEFVA